MSSISFSHARKVGEKNLYNTLFSLYFLPFVIVCNAHLLAVKWDGNGVPTPLSHVFDDGRPFPSEPHRRASRFLSLPFLHVYLHILDIVPNQYQLGIQTSGTFSIFSSEMKQVLFYILIQGPQQSPPSSLIFNGEYFSRLQFSIGYNFLLCLHVGKYVVFNTLSLSKFSTVLFWFSAHRKQHSVS